MKTMRLLAILFSLLIVSAAQQTTTYVAHYSYSFAGPQTYRDSKTGTILYVETDGRHMAAISADGKLLWHRDPFQDAQLPYYRFKHPQVVYLGPASESRPPAHLPRQEEPSQFVAISLANSQFGFLKISNGEFKFYGQD